MWETIKNDPILKAITVVVLGVLAFGFAFNIMFGSSGMESGMSGYSLGNTLSNAITLLVKLLLVVLIISAIIVVIKILNKYLKNQYETSVKEVTGKMKSIKVAGIASASILFLVIALSIISKGNHMPYNNTMMVNSYYPQMYPAAIQGAGSLLEFFAGFMITVFTALLLVALVLYIRDSKNSKSAVNNNLMAENIKCPECGSATSSDFIYCAICGTNLKKKCIECGEVINTAWICCPKCGRDISPQLPVENKNQDVEEEIKEILESVSKSAAESDTAEEIQIDKVSEEENDSRSDDKDVEKDKVKDAAESKVESEVQQKNAEKTSKDKKKRGRK